MAGGGTMVIFGQLEFYNVLTKMWDQEIMWDDSHTDAIGYRYKIRIVGFLHGRALANMGVLPTTGDGDAANAYAQIRYLLAPRSHFEYRVGVNMDVFGGISGAPGVSILTADPANIPNSSDINFKDIENGPKANVLSITSICSDNVFRLEVEFEICSLQCLPTGGTPNNYGVLNNKWSVVDDIDENFYTTRTFTGILRASSGQINVNAYRYLCVPPLQTGMRRDHMNFQASENGLILRYSVTDKEIAFAPPAPATSWVARFSEEFQGVGQLGYYSNADIMLMGDRFVDKQKLISIAASMAEAKFQNGVRLDADNTFWVHNIMVVDEYNDKGSAISLRATAQRTEKTDTGIMGLNSKFLGKPLDGKIEDVVPGYQSMFSRGTRPGETLEVDGPVKMIGALMAYMQSPCVNVFGINQGLAAVSKGTPAAGNLPTITAVVNNGIPDDKSLANYSADNTNAGYESHHMETHDTVKTGRVASPVASSSVGQSTQFSLGDTWNGDQPASGLQGVVMGVLHSPIVRKWMTIFSSRCGAPPAMPKPQDITTPDGQKWKVVTPVEMSVANPKMTADGKYIHRVEMNIQYAGLFIATGGASSFFFGLNPWHITPVYKIGKGAPPAPYQPSVDLNKLTIPWDF